MRALLLCAITLLALALTIDAQSAATSSCDAGCTAVTGVSCLYCPQCGSCDSVGVIDHCYRAGHAHLSFDDGPNEYTAKQLDILKTLGIKASFWIIGANINLDLSYPALVKRIVDEGHLVGSHTQTHVSLNTITSDAVNAEMSQSIAAIQGAVGGSYAVKYMRPPLGELNTPVRQQVQALGLMPVMWNTDTEDLLAGASQATMIGNVTQKVTAYSRMAHSLVFLLHAKADFSIATVAQLVADVQKAGYTFVDSTTCFDASQAGPTANSTQPVQCVHPPTSMGFQGCSTTFGCGNPAGGSCCSHYQSCGATSDFCGVGCLNGACDVCVQGGYIPSMSLYADQGTGSTGAPSGSTTPTPTVTAGATGTTTPTPTTTTAGAGATSLPSLMTALLAVVLVTITFAASAFFGQE